jgi:DNA-binding NarL/FixJ family response regulator
MSVRVAVVDDQALIRAGFAAIIAAQPDLEVVGQAGDGDDAVALVRATLPDVVLMDIRMPGRDGLSATEVIAGDPSLRAVHVIVLTTFEADEYVVGALRAGASGFLGKDVSPQGLVAAIRTVAAGEALLSPRATRGLIDRFLAVPVQATTASSDARLAALTEREREIVGLVGLGLSNDEIADRLVVSPLTVKTHVNRAMSKVEARDRAQLVVLAYQCGLVQPGGSAG